jgi:hypothetical protein
MPIKNQPTKDWEDDGVDLARRVFASESLTLDEAAASPRTAKRKRREQDHADVYLFPGSRESSAYLRKQALRALRMVSGRPATAAA